MIDDIIWLAANSVVGVLLVACLVTAIVVIYRGWAFLQVSTVSGLNSDEAAVEHFLTLLREAQESMIVYDDGNRMEGSIYQDERVIGAVREKLSTNPEFRLSCYFNFDEGLAFMEELGGCDNVKVKTGHGGRPEEDVHYKIVDSGLKAHISRHGLGAKKRGYKIIDFTKVPRGRRAQVADVLLKPYKTHAASVGIW